MERAAGSFLQNTRARTEARCPPPPPRADGRFCYSGPVITEPVAGLEYLPGVLQGIQAVQVRAAIKARPCHPRSADRAHWRL